LAESGRRPSDVYRDIVYLAQSAAHQLPLGIGRQLVVQAAQDPAAGAAMVILDKLYPFADCLIEALLIEALEEESPVVAKYGRLNDLYIRNGGFNDIH
jgi:hypothetical protein